MELGSWAHLVGRLFEVVTARALDDAERHTVEGWLEGAGEADAYWAQSVADQRHGLETARVLAAARPGRRDLVRAGLLHDIGKRHSNLGAIRRSLASFLTKLRLPVRGSWQRYLDHGRLGAEELARWGVEPLVTEFARYHHQVRPASIAEDDWVMLQSADR